VIDRDTLASQAYSTLREQVITGGLAPGRKLVVRELCESLGLSATPIKNALSALEREGFLLTIPHRGFFVPKVSRRDLKEIYELREVIDGIAARRAALVHDRTGLVTFLEQKLAEQKAADGSGAYSEADVAFHRAIWMASDNRKLIFIAENLIGQVRAGSGNSSQVPGRIAEAVLEHEAIIEALGRGDFEQAEALSRKHVRDSASALDRYWQDAGPES
jgi:DNA-binding GntR family transcriptional regulator